MLNHKTCIQLTPKHFTRENIIKTLIETAQKHWLLTSFTCLIVAYAALGFLLAPYLLEKNLVSTMEQQFNAQLRVEKIEINPFVLSLKIQQLELDNPQGKPTARIAEIYTNFQLSSLFRLALTFDEIRLSSPELFITRDKTGNMDFSYLLVSDEAPNDIKSSKEDLGDEHDAELLPTLIYQFSIHEWVVNWSDDMPITPIQTTFGPITIDVNELNTLPDRSGQQTVSISTQNLGTLSWTGDIQLNPLRSAGNAQLQDATFELVSTYLRHETGLELVDGSAELELDYEVYTNESGEIKAIINNINMSLNELLINTFADGTGFDFAGKDQQVLSLPKLQINNGEFLWPERTISLESISLNKPKINLTRSKDGVLNIQPSTAVNDQENTQENTAEKGDSHPLEPWKLSLGNFIVTNLALDLQDNAIVPADTIGISNFNLDIKNISNTPGMQFPTSLNLQTMRGGSVSLNGAVSVLPAPSFDLDMIVDAMELEGLHPYIKQYAYVLMRSGALNINGEISGNSEDAFQFKGKLDVTDLDVGQSVNGERLLSWASFKADNIDFSLAQQKLNVSTLIFDKLYGDILINEDGRLNVGEIRKTDSNPATNIATQVDEVEKTEESAFNINIGEVLLNHASADFQDLSLPLPFAVKIDDLTGKMTTISTESREASRISFEGKVDEFGLARINGSLLPVNPTNNTDISLIFENINVPKFTPYSIPFAGRKVQSGKLDLTLGYKVADGELLGENSIILRDFELGEEVPHPDALNLPYGLAVALLKDVNGTIDIDLPVSGNVDEPDFSYGGVVMKALGNLLVKIIASPFNALGSLLGIEASELEHIKYVDGRFDLTPPEMEKAVKLSEALALRPELQLSFAGVTDATADGLVLRINEVERLLELRTTEIAASQAPSIQDTDLRIMALEALYGEQLTEGKQNTTLEQLKQQFTSIPDNDNAAVENDNLKETTVSFDKLAYANEIRKQLIHAQTLNQNDLDTLANARAQALKSALLAIDPALQERVIILDSMQITKPENQLIEMDINLGAVSD